MRVARTAVVWKAFFVGIRLLLLSWNDSHRVNAVFERTERTLFAVAYCVMCLHNMSPGKCNVVREHGATDFGRLFEKIGQ